MRVCRRASIPHPDWFPFRTGGIGGEHFGYLATSRGHGCDPSVSRYYLDKPDILLGPTRAQHLVAHVVRQDRKYKSYIVGARM